MDTQRDFIRYITAKLELARIPYMIAGSVSSSFYGKPRSTQDVDMIIDPVRTTLENFIKLLGPNYYVSQRAAIDALEHRGMFNIIDTINGWKVDLIIRKIRPFSQEEFKRRRPAELMGVHTWVLSPEDSILSKLEWSTNRESTVQLQDALNVLII
ncbi:MAG: hypothetical protein Q7T74_00720, partial [Candidatus Saccharibacteria bacterium]|nr:hypothetical protein [Candidatus Saccharibacteria bacterium]